MHRKSLLSLFMLSMGVALLVAATMVGVASAKSQRGASGNVLLVTQAHGAFDTLDPQLAYVSNDWGLLYNTELTLLNFPTKAGTAGTKLIPQAALSLPTISNGGKTYIFHIRPGLKLSDGTPVTAANFQRSFERNISPQMYAPFGVYDGMDQFLVGGQAFAQTGPYSCPKGPKCSKNPPNHISGIDASGLTLTIHLTEVVPQFTSIMGMPWFMAIPANMKYAAKKSTILTYASGGPYYISKNDNKSYTLLKRNPHWPSTAYFRSNWPSNPLQIVVKSYPQSNGTAQLLQAEKGQVDIAGVSSQDVTAVAKKYGVNKSNGQFHVGGTTCIDWVTLNNQSANGTTNKFDVRKALNYAISRNSFIKFAGNYSGDSSEQILVPEVPGYSKITYYGGSGNITKAKQVGGNDLKNAPLNIYYLPESNTETSEYEYVYNLAQNLGMKPSPIQANPDDFYDGLMTKATATGPGGFNLAVFGGWCADYADGYDYINVNFDGRTIGDTGNTDYAYFNSSQFNSDMDAAAKKTGSARATAYKNLDSEFVHDYAPVIPIEISNSREFTSKRVHNWVYSLWWGQGFWGAVKLS
jgi:peptide/nickel transport system substrate-binding protein